MNKTRVCIVGLGLLGGSYAMALSQKGHQVTAIDKNPEALEFGLNKGWIQAGATADFQGLLREAELVVLCLYPGDMLPWLRENQGALSPGCLITDVCGVKLGIAEEAQAPPAARCGVRSGPPHGRPGAAGGMECGLRHFRPGQLHHHPPPPATRRRPSPA